MMQLVIELELYTLQCLVNKSDRIFIEEIIIIYGNLSNDQGEHYNQSMNNIAGIIFMFSIMVTMALCMTTLIFTMSSLMCEVSSKQVELVNGHPSEQAILVYVSQYVFLHAQTQYVQCSMFIVKSYSTILRYTTQLSY